MENGRIGTAAGLWEHRRLFVCGDGQTLTITERLLLPEEWLLVQFDRNRYNVGQGKMNVEWRVAMGYENEPTIKDVAAAAGVSIATVSRVLNKQPGYGAKTEARVLEAIEKTGYQRNEIARNLKMKRSDTIAVLVPEITGGFSTKIMSGIHEASMEQDYAVMLCNVGADGVACRRYINLLRERQVGGILACSIPPQSGADGLLYESGIPCVLINSMSFRYPLPYIKIDDFQAMYQATSYLIQRGHTRIGILSGKQEDMIAGRPRMEGYRQALNANGIGSREEWEQCISDFGFQAGRKGAGELLDRAKELTGIVACSDEVAAAVLSVAAERHIRVPDDLSVIGFDDSEIASMTEPTLTTVSQPFREMGHSAIGMLFRQIERHKAGNNRIVPTEIVERRSTKER